MWKVQGRIFLREIWKKYLLVVILILAQCMIFQRNAGDFGAMTGQEYELHVMDYFICFLEGTMPYTMVKGKQPFNIPPFWSLYFIYFILVIGRAASRVSNKYEQQMILKCRSRLIWWRERNIEIWMETAGYVLVTVLVFFLYGIGTGAEVEGINTVFYQQYAGLDIQALGGQTGIILICFSSFFVMLALAYIQYVAAMAVNNVIGIVVPVVILVSSVYHLHPLLIGNYMMLVRQELLLPQGIHVGIQLGISGAVILVMIFTGYGILKRKDLF